jgi:hypothetical protein
MRHLLFHRNDPPRLTIWQRRRAEARRILIALRAEFQDTLDALRFAGGGNLAAGLSLAWVLGANAWQDAARPLEPGEQAKAYWWIVQIVIVIVAAVVAIALAPKPPIPKPAALEDFDAPTAEEGRPVTKVFGEVVITSPNVLWYGDLQVTPIKKKGGKK